MRIVGVEMGAPEVEQLVQRLTERGARDTAQRLSRAARRGTKEIALDAEDQKRLLGTLDNPSGYLADLHRVLMDELAWRRAKGL